LPTTARNHFVQDIERAKALVSHANTLPDGTADEQLLRSDILRSGWMFAVGALDAYFCDAYTDIVAATIIAKSRQPNVALPDFFYDIKFPVRAILEPYVQNENWRWRMAARKMMERETVLRLNAIQTLFNKFFRPGHKFFRDLIGGWMGLPVAKKRLFGITHTAYNAILAPDQRASVNDAWDQMQERYRDIFQRRHDCIHNCDRPKVSPQSLTRPGTVGKVIQDVEFLVIHSDDHITSEFRIFLSGLGCSPATIAQAGY
jgi:hypothetical protein